MVKQTLYEPGGIYHLFNHANGRENIFEEPENYRYFLTKYTDKMDGVVKGLAHCLMPNHFHLLVKVREETVLLEFLEKKKARQPKVFVPEGLTNGELYHFIVHRQFHNFLGGYAKAFNKYHDRSGSLLRQNTRRKIVSERDYIMNAIRYLHLNPVHHGFTVLPEEWPHSSYPTFLGDQPTSLPRNEILTWFGGKENFIEFHLEKLHGGLEDKFEQ